LAGEQFPSDSPPLGTLKRGDEIVCSNNHGVRIESMQAIAVPIAFALPAMETILKEFAQRPGAANLALNIQDMHVPLETLMAVPVRVGVKAGLSRNEWQLSICAAVKPELYPIFDGQLRLLDAATSGAQIQLEGTYVVPLGAVGHAIDVTLLHGLAESSLHRFVHDLAIRVAALSRWAALV
jgi:hypothetical protein